MYQFISYDNSNEAILKITRGYPDKKPDIREQDIHWSSGLGALINMLERVARYHRIKTFRDEDNWKRTIDLKDIVEQLSLVATSDYKIDQHIQLEEDKSIIFLHFGPDIAELVVNVFGESEHWILTKNNREVGWICINSKLLLQ